MTDSVTLASLETAAARVGLALRGALHPAADEFAPLAGGRPVRTVVLLGFTGGLQWAHFQAAPEASDGLPEPLDRWSQRVIDTLALDLAARAFYPGDTPCVPFQALARRGDAVYPSPLGLLIHPRFGLWHAYRGGLCLAGRLVLPARAPARPPCETCVARPCLSACPVHAFGAGGFAPGACVGHLQAPAGHACIRQGCLARAACPVGTAYRYGEGQLRFHQAAFLRAVTGN